MESVTERNTAKAPQPGENQPDWFSGNIVDPFLNALTVQPYNALANAVNGVAQNEMLPKQQLHQVSETTMMSPGWFAQTVSGGLGLVLPYLVAGKIAGASMRSAAARFRAKGAESEFLKSEAAAQVVGAAAFDFARDTHPGETRLGNALAGATGFYIFARGNAAIHADSFWQRQAMRAGIGSLGGSAQVFTSRITSGELPSGRQLLEGGLTGATLNLALHPTQAALGKGYEFAENKYYSLKWQFDKQHTAARRWAYATLNEYNLRHPVQRLGDWIYGGEEAAPRLPRAPLTAENNPAIAFERANGEYFRRMNEQEQRIADEPDRARQYEMIEEEKQIQQNFGRELLAIWHGTPERPGFAQYSDAELAASGISQQRVAQIRDALTSSNKAEYPNLSPLTQKLAGLANFDINHAPGRPDHYALSRLGKAKEEFFAYDEEAMGRIMRMPPLHAHRDHGYGTPVDWMPFEPTQNMPNLFHGSISESLPSIFRERMMLPASELRIRGIKQTTGESAGEEFPRRSISLTRDFTEAFCYHRHSPEFLTSYPIIIGVSRTVAPRMRSAGMLEAGELLIDRLRVGQSLFGLRQPEISHLFVPNSEIAAVNRQLGIHRIRGVRVIGLNDLQTPAWKPEPKPEPGLDW